MKDKLIASFDTKGSRVLIGGRFDGRRHVPEDRNQFKKLIMPVPILNSISDHLSPVSPIAGELRHEVYLPEMLRGNQIEMIFYRHESITVDQALVLLLARYPSTETK